VCVVSLFSCCKYLLKNWFC